VESRLLPFLLAGGSGGLGRLRLDHALLELIDAPSGIDEFLRAGVKRVTNVANANENGLLGGAGFDNVAAGATNLSLHVFGMYADFHKSKAAQLTSDPPINKSYFATLVMPQ
jgi:hypothetical protein